LYYFIYLKGKYKMDKSQAFTLLNGMSSLRLFFLQPQSDVLGDGAGARGAHRRLINNCRLSRSAFSHSSPSTHERQKIFAVYELVAAVWISLQPGSGRLRAAIFPFELEAYRNSHSCHC